MRKIIFLVVVSFWSLTSKAQECQNLISAEFKTAGGVGNSKTIPKKWRVITKAENPDNLKNKTSGEGLYSSAILSVENVIYDRAKLIWFGQNTSANPRYKIYTKSGSSNPVAFLSNSDVTLSDKTKEKYSQLFIFDSDCRLQKIDWINNDYLKSNPKGLKNDKTSEITLSRESCSDRSGASIPFTLACLDAGGKVEGRACKCDNAKFLENVWFDLCPNIKNRGTVASDFKNRECKKYESLWSLPVSASTPKAQNRSKTVR